MSNKDDILKKYRANVREKFDMPDLSDIKAITYPEPLVQFVKMTEMVGGQAIEVDPGRDINVLIRELFPDAKEIASNLPEITIATRNPDTVGRARDLNGTDVGIIRGKFGVAENACVWIPQTMKEKAICFISENLIILLPKSQIVNNMHEAPLFCFCRSKRVKEVDDFIDLFFCHRLMAGDGEFLSMDLLSDGE